MSACAGSAGIGVPPLLICGYGSCACTLFPPCWREFLRHEGYLRMMVLGSGAGGDPTPFHPCVFCKVDKDVIKNVLIFIEDFGDDFQFLVPCRFHGVQLPKRDSFDEYFWLAYWVSFLKLNLIVSTIYEQKYSISTKKHEAKNQI
jgi:hypothetical protein